MITNKEIDTDSSGRVAGVGNDVSDRNTDRSTDLERDVDYWEALLKTLIVWKAKVGKGYETLTSIGLPCSLTDRLTLFS